MRLAFRIRAHNVSAISEQEIETIHIGAITEYGSDAPAARLRVIIVVGMRLTLAVFITASVIISALAQVGYLFML